MPRRSPSQSASRVVAGVQPDVPPDVPRPSEAGGAIATRGALHASLVDRLIEVLQIERRLVDRLSSLLAQQRAAIFASAPDEIIECTYDMQRVLLTVEEARKQRRLYATHLVGGGDFTVPELIERLSPLGSSALTASLVDISASARTLRAESLTHRLVLERVVGDDDAIASRARLVPLDSDR
jgi:hypothetical protein